MKSEQTSNDSAEQDEQTLLTMLAEREQEIALLIEISELLSIEFDIDRLLQIIAERTQSLIHATTVLVPILDTECEEYTYRAGCGESVDEILGESLPIDYGICGWVWKNRRAWWQGELEKLSDEEKTRWEHSARNVLLVPLQGKRHFLGGIACMNKTDGSNFDKRDKDLLTLFANQAAIALENALLYEQVHELNTNLEKRVRQRTEQLQEVNEELASFNYSVSHDLRAPLRAIIGFSEALVEDNLPQLDEAGKDYLQRINHSAHKMNALIEALLSLAKLRRSEMEHQQVDLSALAQDVATEIRQEEGVEEIVIDITPNIVVKADAGMIRVLLFNLFSNAFKFSKNTEQPAIEFASTQVDGTPVFYIRDNGIGFDMNYANKLFTAFQRLHRDEDYEGTGIGLATVAQVVHRHGGKIWAESKPGQGATFFFTLC